MSEPRFAAITADLLARKGDARPSADAKQAFFWRTETPAVASQPPHKPGHRITVMLSEAEHQALGIAAVKKNVTRHQLVRDALDRHLAALAAEYGGCACIGQGWDNRGWNNCARDCGTEKI
jgi:hypothetical protein